MPEIVGTAYVRIKAITDGVAKDIQSGLDKGAADVDGSGAGRRVGTTFTQGVVDGIDKGGDDVDAKLGSLGKDADDSSGFTFAQRWASKFYLGLEKATDKKKEDGFFKGLTKNLDKLNDKLKVPRIALAGLFGAPAIGGAVQALGGYIVSIVGQLGYLSTAAIGAAAGITGAFGAAALAIGPLMLAFKAQTPELDVFQAKASAIGDIWKDVGVATQKYLLPALTEAMESSLELVPTFEVFGESIGAVSGMLAKFATEMLTSNQVSELLHNILDAAIPIFESLGLAAVAFARGMLELFDAVIPLASRFAGTIQHMAGQFALFMTAQNRSGQLTQTLTEWYDRAELVGQAFIDFGKIIWNVFKVGADAATPFFETFAAFAQKWADFSKTEVGQAKIKGIFEEAVPVAQSINALLRDIIGWIVQPIGKDSSGIVRFFDTLRTVMLPSIQKIAEQLTGNLSGALDTFVQSILGFLEATASSGSLEAFFGVLGQVLNVLTAIMQIPGLDTFVGLMLTLGGAFKAVHFAAKPFIAVMTGFKDLLSSSMGKAAFKPVIEGFEAFITNPKGGLTAAKDGLSTFIGSIGGVGLAMGGITIAAAVGAAAFMAWQTNVKRVEQESKTFAQTLLNGGDALEELDKSYRNILNTRQSFDSSMEKSGISIARVTNLVNENTGDVDKFRAAWHHAGGGFKQFREEGGKVPASMQGIIAHLEKLGEAGTMSQGEINEVIDGMTDLDKQAQAAQAGIAAQADQLLKAGEAAGLSADQMKYFAEAADTSGTLEEQNEALQQGIALYPVIAEEAGVSMQTITQVSQEVNRQFQSIIDKLDKLAGRQLNADQATRDFAQSQIELSEKFATTGGVLAGQTKEALANRDALDGMIASGKRAAEAQASVDSTGQSSIATLKGLQQQIILLGQAGGLSTDEVNALLDSFGLLDDQQIQAQVSVATDQAITDTEALKKEIREMDGVTEPVRLRLNALVDSGSVDQARAAMEAFKKQQAAEDILLAVHGDISKAENDIFALLGWTKEQDGTVNIEGNKYPYEEAVKAAKEYAEGTTGTVTITGDDGEARVVAQGTQSYINSLTGTINLTATIRKEELQRMTREAARIVEDAAGRQMTVGQADKGTSLITMGVGGVVIPTAATAFGGPTFSPAVVGTSLRSTIAQGRAMGAPSAGGMSGLLAKGGAIGPLASGHHGAGGDTGSVEDSTNVAVPSDGGGSATPTVNIIVKIGDRDITDIVDVQMNGRMGQLATAMRRAG